MPEVPALHNLTAGRLHALNFGCIAAPVARLREPRSCSTGSRRIVRRRRRRCTVTEGPDPVFSLKLSSVDYDRLLDLVPDNETATGVLQQIVRDLVCAELGLPARRHLRRAAARRGSGAGRQHQVR